ncbi:MAG: FUSC family protein [Myxococcales bacterium]|nr:FUSC family protein [Myxococcales bacterium]
MTLPGLDLVGHHVREAARLAPGRPALWLGLRTAAATAVPLIAAQWLDPTAASWAPLAGFLVALADKGGAYRSRAITMASVGIGGLAAVIIGSLIAGHGLVTAVLVAIGLTACALAQAWGPAMVGVGNSIAIQLLVAASLPCSPHEVVERALGFAGGAGFALVLGLIVWPVRVYKPGRRAVAAVFRALAEHARALAAASADDPTWREQVVARHRAIRDQIEIARVVLAATRRGRRGETGRGERLLATVQLCDQLFGILLGLEEALDAGCPPEAHAIVTRGLVELAAGLDALATDVVIERPPKTSRRTWTAEPPAAADPVARALGAHALALISRAHEDRITAEGVIASLGDDSEPLRAHVPEPEPRRPLREVLRDALDPSGFVLRHAVRVAVVVSVAMTLARVLDLSHRYWVTLTAFLLLTPLAAATRVRALQRVVGTIVGGVLAAAVPWAVDDPRIVLVLIVVLAGLSASVVQLNYAIYASLMTPTFVLLAEVHSTEVDLVGIRIANTLIGAGLVVLGTLLWPARPSARFDDEIADAYQRAAHYLDVVIAAITGAVPQPSADVVEGRRAFGLVLNRAELALEQLVSERAPPEVTEPRMTQLVFLRRLGSAINTLGSTRTVAGYAVHHVEIAAFGASITGGLHDLSAHMREGTPLATRPRLDRAYSDPVLAARVARIDAALANLTAAALRAAPDVRPALAAAR